MSVFNMKNITQHESKEAEKPLVMLVDDEIENLNVLRQLLEKKFQIITGLNGQEAIQLIDNMKDPTKIQLIISDQRMPNITGVEFLERIVERMPNTIRIILTGYSDTQVIIDAINKAKLYKFITKPFDPIELTLTVQRGIEAFQMRQELIEYSTNLERIVADRTEELNDKNDKLIEALKALEKLSLSDQLTGVHNRYFLNKFLPPELEKIKRGYSENKYHDNQLGFLMVDIDFFKEVNDIYGHDAGDKILVKFAKIFTETCRQSDWVCRWGGEEFVIIARGLTKEELQGLAQRIIRNVAAHKFELGCGQSISKSCSIGITSFPFIKEQFSKLSWEQTLNLADLALYLAKNNGRSTWVNLFEGSAKPEDSIYEEAMINLKKVIDDEKISYCSPKALNSF